MRETEGWTEEEKQKKREGGVKQFLLSIAEVRPRRFSLSIHYPVQYIRGQYCTLPAESTLILRGEDPQC